MTIFGRQLTLGNRSVRFLQLWAINLVKFLCIVLISLTIGGYIGYMLVLASAAYGANIVLAGIAATWVVLLTAVVAGAIAEDQLAKLEEKERRIMDRMRHD